jgi:hypothetical protein
MADGKTLTESRLDTAEAAAEKVWKETYQPEGEGGDKVENN